MGPLISLLYFNDVHLIIEYPRLSYVDDLKMFLQISSTTDSLNLQQQRCSVITFTRKKKNDHFRIHSTWHDTQFSRHSLLESHLLCVLLWSTALRFVAQRTTAFAGRIESVQYRFLRFALRKLPWRDPFCLPSYENLCQLIDLELLRARRDAVRAMTIADIL